jgi:hypothetical protein
MGLVLQLRLPLPSLRLLSANWARFKSCFQTVASYIVGALRLDKPLAGVPGVPALEVYKGVRFRDILTVMAQERHNTITSHRISIVLYIFIISYYTIIYTTRPYVRSSFQTDLEYASDRL